MKFRERIQRLDEIYKEIPEVHCKGLCQDSCGPIHMTKTEWSRIRGKTGREPKGRSLTLDCPLLIDGKCSVYDIRPIVCRLWGAMEKVMICPHGCEADDPLVESDARYLLRQVDQAGGLPLQGTFFELDEFVKVMKDEGIGQEEIRKILES